MTEGQLDAVHEAYHMAIHHLVTGPAGLRQRLKLALAALQKCKRLCDLVPTDQYEGKVTKDLPRLLGAAELLGAMKPLQLEDLAWDIWRVQHDVQEVLAARAGVEWGETPP